MNSFKWSLDLTQRIADKSNSRATMHCGLLLNLRHQFEQEIYNLKLFHSMFLISSIKEKWSRMRSHRHIWDWPQWKLQKWLGFVTFHLDFMWRNGWALWFSITILSEWSRQTYLWQYSMLFMSVQLDCRAFEKNCPLDVSFGYWFFVTNIASGFIPLVRLEKSLKLVP